MSRRSPSLVLAHVVWATYRRQPRLTIESDEALLGILGATAAAAGCALLSAGCGADHVHVAIRLAPSVALSDLVRRLKGVSSHDMNVRLASGERITWQAGYWAESFSPTDMTPLATYIRNQRRHHDDSHPAEAWQRAAEPFDDEHAR